MPDEDGTNWALYSIQWKVRHVNMTPRKVLSSDSIQNVTCPTFN